MWLQGNPSQNLFCNRAFFEWILWVLLLILVGFLVLCIQREVRAAVWLSKPILFGGWLSLLLVYWGRFTTRYYPFRQSVPATRVHYWGFSHRILPWIGHNASQLRWLSVLQGFKDIGLRVPVDKSRFQAIAGFLKTSRPQDFKTFKFSFSSFLSTLSIHFEITFTWLSIYRIRF